MSIYTQKGEEKNATRSNRPAHQNSRCLKVTEIKPTESGNTMDAEYIGAFKRFDRIPKEIWSARVCTFFAEGEDKLLVVIERDNDDKN